MKTMSIIGIILFFLFFLAAYDIFNNVSSLNLGDTMIITQDKIIDLQGHQVGNILVGLFGLAFSIVSVVHAFRNKGNRKIKIAAKEIDELVDLRQKELLTEKEFISRIILTKHKLD
jgi:hypothetical protein